LRIRSESLETLSSLPSEPTLSDDAADPAAEFLLAAAQKRLRAALEGLDHAVSRHHELVLEQADQVAEYSLLQEDRSRLAQELDTALGRAHALEAANLEAARRIERASAAVRAVIAGDLGADPDSDPAGEG
jgi:chromosome segregation ATPase